MAFNEDAIASSQEAIAEYKETLKVNPKFILARNNLNRIHKKMFLAKPHRTPAA